MMDKMNNKLEYTIKDLPENEQNVIRKIKDFLINGYEFIKPVVIGIFMFWLFYRIKDAVGIQETFFIQGVIIIIFLRVIASRLA